MAFSPTDAVFEGFRLVRREPTTLVMWALLYFVALVIFVVAILAIVGFGALAQLGVGGQPDPARLQALMMSFAGAFAVLFPFALFAMATMRCAVYRAVLRPEDKGFAYLRLGADELRVAVVMLTLAILGLAAIGVPAGALAAGIVGLWRSGSHVGSVLLGIVGYIAIFCGAIFIGVRMSLASVDTFASKAVHIWEGWEITRTNFFNLLGMYLLRFLLSLAVAFVGGIAAFVFQLIGGVGSLAAVGGDHTNLAVAAPVMIVAGLGNIAVNLGVGVIQLANQYAPEAAAWRDLAGQDAASVF